MKQWKQRKAWILTLIMVMTVLTPAAKIRAADITNKEDTVVTATVPVSSSTYYVMIPENIDFGELDASKDYVKDYEIDVSEVSNAGQKERSTVKKVKVTSPETGNFYLAGNRNSKYVLPFTNSYGTQIFDVGSVTGGTLRIEKEDIAKAVSGSYSGNVIFTVTEINDETDPGGDPSGGDTDGGNKTVETSVNLMQYTDITQKSMCDPLFYNNAVLTTRDDGKVDVELYLIDPIPGFASTDPVTPLSRLYLTGNAKDLNFPADDTDASAQITLNPVSGSFGMQAQIDKSTSYNKEYDPYSVYILEKGTYQSRKVTFTLPLSAVQNSKSGTIIATGYVDAVMNVWKQFYMVFGDVSDLTGDEGNGGSGGNGSGNNGSGTGGSGSNDSGNNGSGNNNSGTGGNGNSSDSNGSGSGNDGTVSLNNSNYTASVSIRKSTDVNSTSMCDPLFYSKADLVVNGDTTKVTMYVIDPIPNYPGEGTPLSNIVFQAGGTSFQASLDTANKVSRAYEAASGFISQAGNYYSDPITVTLPTSAVETSGSGSIQCSAYVNAVMKTTQKFYVVFSNLVEGEKTASSGQATAITGDSANAGSEDNTLSGDKSSSGDNITLGEEQELQSKDQTSGGAAKTTNGTGDDIDADTDDGTTKAEYQLVTDVPWTAVALLVVITILAGTGVSVWSYRRRIS